MRRALFGIVLLCLPCASRAEECSLGRVAAIPMHALPSGRAAIDATINGTPRQLLVDTGGV